MLGKDKKRKEKDNLGLKNILYIIYSIVSLRHLVLATGHTVFIKVSRHQTWHK